MKNQIFSPKKKFFSGLQNLHPGVFRGAEADFEVPGDPGGPTGARPGGAGRVLPGPAQGVGGMA